MSHHHPPGRKHCIHCGEKVYRIVTVAGRHYWVGTWTGSLSCPP